MWHVTCFPLLGAAARLEVHPAVPHSGDRQELNRRVLELTTLYEISKLLGSCLDLNECLMGTLRLLSSFMGMRKGTILLSDPLTGELSVRLALGMTPEDIARSKVQLGQGILGQVIRHGAPLVIPDVGQDPRFLDPRTLRHEPPAQPIAFLAVPIKVGGETIGVLTADRLSEEKESLDKDLNVLSIVASLIGQTVNLQQRLAREREGLLAQTRSLQQALRGRYRLENIVGQSPRMRDVFEAVEQVSQTRATVLIRGESGTGKELVARAIHYRSPRASRPFVRVNCASLPQSLLESELFGHEKGAFTGATGLKKGRFELADGGSLFLDEIGDLPLAVQVKILRVLQERCFERVGGTRTIAVDVRIIAATHQDLEAAIGHGTFREDLYYRLNVVPLLLPPLRERREDIPLLIEHFLARFNRENNRRVRLTGRALQLLLGHDWPGNVRELENCVERMVIMARRRILLPEDLPLPLQPTADESHESTPRSPRFPRRRLAAPGAALPTLRAMEREQIVKALTQSGGIQARAAALLGITPRQFAYRLRKYGIVRTFQVEGAPLSRQA
jgi:Nif-specific regulatory protein